MDDVGGKIQNNKNKAPSHALWLNKRALASIGFPFEHTLLPTTSGWDVVIEGEGVLVLTFGDGKRDAVVVGPGDRLQSSGDDLYLATASSALGPGRELTDQAEVRRPTEEPRPRPAAKRASKATAARKATTR